MRLLFVGDIMPGGVLPYQNKWYSEEILRFLKEFDCRIGTLECALGNDIPFDEEKMKGKMNIIYSPSKEIARLKELDINIVSLANNHIYDLGKEGLENTIDVLKKNNIPFCGAGKNLEDAAKPAVINIQGKSIAFFAWCQYNSVYIGHLKRATENSPGVNSLDINTCVKQIKAAKQKYDFVFALPHWGNEYQYLPTPTCNQYARLMIEAGADGVFASHTHQVQPIIEYRHKPIAFSMGNFLFPDYIMQPPRPIWYPDKEIDFSHLDRLNYYPKRISEPCIQIWRHLSRIGMMVEYNCDGNKSKTEYYLNYLTEDNILEIYNRSSMLRMRLKWMGYITKSTHYTGWFKFYHWKWNVPRRFYHLLKRITK